MEKLAHPCRRYLSPPRRSWRSVGRTWINWLTKLVLKIKTFIFLLLLAESPRALKHIVSFYFTWRNFRLRSYLRAYIYFFTRRHFIPTIEPCTPHAHHTPYWQAGQNACDDTTPRSSENVSRRSKRLSVSTRASVCVCFYVCVCVDMCAWCLLCETQLVVGMGERALVR